MTRILRSTLVAVALAAVALIVPASPAQALLTSLTCTGTQVVDYAPGLTTTPQDVQATATNTWANCIPLGSGPTQGSGGFTALNPGASCVLSVSSVVNVATYTWNNSTPSVITFTTTIPTRLANGSTVVTSTGTVTAGYGQGATATRVVVLLPAAFDSCTQPGGVTQLQGPATLTLLGL